MSDKYLGFGAFPSPKDIRDYKLKPFKQKEMPTSYFVVGKAVIKNQGKQPTCVAHALSEIIEYFYQKENRQYERFSTDFIYGLRDNSAYKKGQEGMYLREGLSIIKEYGDVFYDELTSNSNTAVNARTHITVREAELKEKAYPYRITSYYKINSIEELQYSLTHHGPVAGSMKWYEGSKLSKYIYKFNPNNKFSGHAVLIIGWINDYFIIQNSWGKYWGRSGLFLIHKNDIPTVFFELYGVTDDIQSIKRPSKPIKKIAPFINFWLNRKNK